MSRRTWVCAAALLGAALALVLASCRHPVAPKAPLRVVRPVTLVLKDDAGAPVIGAPLILVSAIDSAGVAPARSGVTQSGGRAVFSLRSGPWSASTGPLTIAGERRVVGGTFLVAYSDRDTRDTVLVALSLASPSRASGIVTLEDGADPAGTSVTSPELPYVATTTGEQGQWALADLPPGTWHFSFKRFAYWPATRTVIVPPGGASATVPAFALVAQRAGGTPYVAAQGAQTRR